MDVNSNSKDTLPQLRAEALNRLGRDGAGQAHDSSLERLAHEIEVQKFELEMRNEALRDAHAALKKLESRYVNLYDFAPVGYVTLLDDGLVTEANLTACALFGVERTHLLNSRFDQFIASGLHSQWHRQLRHSLQAMEPTAFELMLKRADGSLFHAQMNCSAATNDDQERTLRVTLTDISEYVAARQNLAVQHAHLEELIAVRADQLAASEKKVTGFMDLSIAGVFIVQDGLIRFANRLFAEIFGYSSSLDLIDRVPFEQLMMHADSEQQAQHPEARYFSGIEPEADEWRYCFVGLRRDGSPVHLDVHGRRIEHLGKPAMLGVVIDVSASKRARDEQQEIEIWLRAITDHAAANISLKSVDGRYLFVNRRFEQVFHLQRSAVRGKRDHDLFPPEIADACTKTDKAAAGSRRSFETEEQVLHEDGVHTYLTVKFPIKNRAGKVYAIGGIATDITARKMDERRLAASESSLRTILDTEPEAVMQLDRDGGLLHLNPAGLTMIEADSLAQVADYPMHLLVEQRHREAFVELTRRVFAGESGKLEFTIVGLKGTPRWLETHSVPLRDANGQVTALLGITRDVTEQKRTQSTSMELLRRLELVMKHAKDCIMVFDSDMRIIEVSDSCLQTYGYTRDEMYAMKAIDLRAPEAREAAESEYQRLIEQRSSLYQTVHCRKDGTSFPAEVSATVVGNGRGGFTQVIIRDITERVRERLKMQQELAEYSDRLDAASQRLLVVQEEARRRLSAELHDRTSPNLAAIDLNLNMINTLASCQSKERAHCLDDLRALVDDTQSSIREICTELRPPALDYAGLATTLEGYLSQFEKRTGIAVQFVCTNPEKRLIPFAESLLFRICQEALTNCLKHAHAHSIEVRLDNGADPIVLTIIDDGEGFDLHLLQTKGEIFGLGLLNMREMVEFSGGQFSIESSPGKGTRIEVKI